jgi:hypothetical protein
MSKPTSIKSILKLNTVAMWLHFIQGIAMISLVSILGTSKNYDITLNYLTYSEELQTLIPGKATIASINFAWLVASFLFMSAIAHAIIITVYRKKYVSDLEKGINKARWIEYSISASTMMVAIALLSGMNDIASLTMLFGLVAIMNLLGLVMEVVNSGKKTGKLA